MVEKKDDSRTESHRDDTKAGEDVLYSAAEEAEGFTECSQRGRSVIDHE
jgi:hypothetical protein